MAMPRPETSQDVLPLGEDADIDLFVAGLPFALESRELLEIAQAYGKVTEARHVKDPVTGASRGFGYLRMPNSWERDRVLVMLDGHQIGSHELRVSPLRVALSVETDAAEESTAGDGYEEALARVADHLCVSKSEALRVLVMKAYARLQRKTRQKGQ